MSNEITTQDVVKNLQKAKWVMVTGVGAEDKLISHPMVPQQVTDGAEVWFFISLIGDQAKALRNNPEVNISHSEAGAWLSVSGRAEFVADSDKIDELWNKDVEGWFDGKDDPALGLIKVNSETAQYWGTPGGRAGALLQLVKARLSDEHESGESQTLEL